MATGSLTGRVLVSVGEGDAQEVATFAVPIVMHMTLASTEATAEVGDFPGALVAALREAADRIEAESTNPFT